MRHRLIALLLMAYILLGFTYAVTTPVFEASDELWHYPVIQQLASGGALPVLDADDPGPWRQEAGQPPLYYLMMAMATRWIDTGDIDDIRWLNPHVDNGVITADGNINMAIHTEAEHFPWRGTVLAVRLIRLLSVLMGGGTVYLTYRLALEIRPQWRTLAVGSAGVVAFTPMFVFISSAVNNDSLAMLLASWTVFVVARMGVHGDIGAKYRFALNWEWNRVRGHISLAHALVGVLLGLGALSKLSVLALFPIAGALIAYNESARWWVNPNRTRFHVFGLHVLVLTLQIGVTFGIAALISGWWYIRNIRLYGTLTGLEAFVSVLGRRSHPAPLEQLWSERWGFMQSYWGLFGGVNLPYPDWVYAVLNMLTVLCVIGIGIFLIRKWLDDRWTVRRWLPIGTIGAFVLIVVFSLVRWATDTWSSQGRLVFTAIQSISVLFTFGLVSLIPRRCPRWRQGLLALLLLFLFVVTAAGPGTVIVPSYADPPSADLSTMQYPTETDFGLQVETSKLRLLGYTLESETTNPSGDVVVTLYWQALAVMERDWSVFLHLIDQDGIIVAQRDSYPGVGLLPTTRMQPEQTVADRYVIPIPATAYSPSEIQVMVGLYDFYTDERLPTIRGSDSVELATLSLQALPGNLPNPQSINFQNQVEFVGYELEERLASPGEHLSLTLYWRGQQDLDVNYSVFAHLRGKGMSLWGQHDSWPSDGAAPTSTWVSGQVVEDTHIITVAPDTPPGTYTLEVGLYDDSGLRLQVINPEGRWTENFVDLSRVRVVES